jgi:uncharacterized protein YgiM (DUF1202 family)
VNCIKIRIFTLILILSLLMPSPPRVQAATMASYAGAVTTSTSALNVRAAASAASSVIATLKKGSHITLISREGNWWRVEYGPGKYGYCHSDYITPIEGTPANVTASFLNVRSGRGTTHSIQGVLNGGDVVIVLNTVSGWSRILYHGTKIGYVSAAYLSTGSTYAAITLNVPSFKQYDSRWASKEIGASGKTFAQIGCATTAIAMMESYRTGTTIYPDAMASRLRYTPGGSVYWPDNYQVVTESNGYLEKLYTLLKAGKPVLFGAKTTAGKQHWVVVTGFTGGALTEAGFTIHDPGSGSRVTLQQFLNIYPVFYKYFSY